MVIGVGAIAIDFGFDGFDGVGLLFVLCFCVFSPLVFARVVQLVLCPMRV